MSKYKRNYMKRIMFLSITALIGIITDIIMYFVTLELYKEQVYLYDLLILIFELIPRALLLLYVFKYNKKFSIKWLLSITLISIILYDVLCFYERLSFYRLLLGGTGSVILVILKVAVLLIAIVYIFNGMQNKCIPILAVSLCITQGISTLITTLFRIPYYFQNLNIIYLCTDIIEVVGYTSMFVALLLLIINYRTPELELKALQRKYKRGLIPEQEYRVLRAYIINKL